MVVLPLEFRHSRARPGPAFACEGVGESPPRRVEHFGE
jgi:hypothetical protein